MDNKFFDTFADIITSKFFSLILSLISLSIATGFIATKIIGIFVFLFVFTCLLLFLIIVIIFSKKSKSNYSITQLSEVWNVGDADGLTVTCEREVKIKLLSPREFIYYFIDYDEEVSNIIGQHTQNGKEYFSPIRKKYLIPFKATYRKNKEIEFIIRSSRNKPIGKVSNYVHIFSYCKIINFDTKIFLQNNNGSKLVAKIYKEERGSIEELESQYKTLDRKKENRLDLSTNPINQIAWKEKKLELFVDYFLEWNWN